MAWYRAGTVSVTNSSTTVTGAGTDWVANSRVGDALVGPDGRTYEITNVASATAISILPSYQGSTASAQAYAIIPVQGYTRDLADQAGQLINEYDAALDKPWIGANDAADARTGLGLGSAATRNVGTVSGNVMGVGAFGLGSTSNSYDGFGDANLIPCTGFWYSSSFNTANRPSASAGPVMHVHGAAGFDLYCRDDLVRVRGFTGSVFRPWRTIYTEANVVVDTNGFLKAASPVLRLFSDRVEDNWEASLQKSSFSKLDTGHYTISNTQGLADEGWYIETPRDANGLQKRFVEYSQTQAEDGTWTITVQTFSPDYSTGALTAGEPMDLDERWIDVRLNSLPEQAADESDAQPI